MTKSASILLPNNKNAIPGRQRQVDLLNLRPVWSTELVLGQPELHKGTVSQQPTNTNSISKDGSRGTVPTLSPAILSPARE